jgi:hypothetical protein
VRHLTNLPKALLILAAVLLVSGGSRTLTAQNSCPGNYTKSQLQCSCGQKIDVSGCQNCIGDCPNCSDCWRIVYCCNGQEGGCLALSDGACLHGEGPKLVRDSKGFVFAKEDAGCFRNGGEVADANTDANPARK